VVQIDWLTVGAQIVNFLILVALLKRFLYRPVLDAMDRRERRIAQRLHDADERERQADARAREFREKAEDLDRRKERLLEQARDEAEAERRERLQEARREVEHQRERWRTQLDQEWEDVQKAIRRSLADAVTAATRRALADLADTQLEKAMSRAFTRRLARLDDAQRQAIAASAGSLEVATTFEPDEEMRATLGDAVREAFGRDVRFVRADGLAGGIEVRARGWKLSWSVAEYLRDLEDRLGGIIAAVPVHAEPKGEH
jgi:F-type H+-transporting ATPase subunit b